MKRNQIDFIVQASSRSWSGGKDLCMNLVDGFPVIYWTLRKIIDNFPEANVVVAAPEFDENGDLNGVVNQFQDKVNMLYAHDDSPLFRIIATHERFLSGDYFVRIDALNMFFMSRDIEKMYEFAVGNSLDCCKFPDAYPAQLTADIYNINALKKAKNFIDKTSPYVVHPKYYMFKNSDFRTAFFDDTTDIKDEYLSNCRNIAKQIYLIPRGMVTGKNVKFGDQLSFHYQLATKYINREDRLLDIACGDGFGLCVMADYTRHIDGADISPEIIQIAKEKCKNLNNVKLHVEDVLNMTFADNTFDIITSFETIEHVEPESYFREIQRVLKHGGRFILSTPQNSLGHIPINSQHNHEYSLEEIQNMTSKYFKIHEIIGIKQGCIIHEGDGMGSNTFMILVNEYKGNENVRS